MNKKGTTTPGLHKSDMESSMQTLDVSEMETLQKKLDEIQGEIKEKDQ